MSLQRRLISLLLAFRVNVLYYANAVLHLTRINTDSLRYQNFPKNLKKNKTQLSGLRALKVSNIYAPFATLAQYKGFKLFIFVETQYTLKLNLLQRTDNNSGLLISGRSLQLSLTRTRPPVLSLTAWSYRSEVVERQGLKRRKRIYFGFYL